MIANVEEARVRFWEDTSLEFVTKKARSKLKRQRPKKIKP